MSAALKYVWDSLAQLGLPRSTPSIALAGIDAGEALNLRYLLQTGSYATREPSIYPSVETARIGNTDYSIGVPSANEAGRREWPDHLPGFNGIVFLVPLESTDPEDLTRSKNELHELLASDALSGKPIAVLGTQDAEPAATAAADLRTKLFLSDQEKAGRPLEVFACSPKLKKDHLSAFEWLSKHI